MAESWIQCVTRVYRKNKKTNKNYTLKNAMKDAKKVYKPNAAAAPHTAKKHHKKSRKTRSRR